MIENIPSAEIRHEQIRKPVVVVVTPGQTVPIRRILRDRAVVDFRESSVPLVSIEPIAPVRTVNHHCKIEQAIIVIVRPRNGVSAIRPRKDVALIGRTDPCESAVPIVLVEKDLAGGL